MSTTPRFRAEELAEQVGVSVAALRSYQSKGLLPPPRHEGRVAYYGAHHVDRLRRIVALKGRGHTLKSIAEQLESPLSPLVEEDESERLRLRDVADDSGVPIEMLRSLEASGVLLPREDAEGAYYSASDVRAVSCVLLLVGSGIPTEQFLQVALGQVDACGETAGGAVNLFRTFVEAPLRASVEDDDEVDPDERVDEAIATMGRAIAELVGYWMERQVEIVAPPAEAPEPIDRPGRPAS
jgi:DNA-binding transcriptional MerR regulator